MYRSLHEDSAVADLKDIVNIAQGAASADDYSYSSIAKAASNLTAIFPILVSKTVSGETARIVSKFIEQKACTLFMLGLQQANVDTARDGIAHFKKFHQNLKGSDNRRSAFKPIVDFLKIYTKVTEAANSNEDLECECDSLLEADDVEVNAQALKGLMESLAKAPNVQFYDTQLNPVSINDFGVKETDGNYRVTIRGIDSLHENRNEQRFEQPAFDPTDPTNDRDSYVSDDAAYAMAQRIFDITDRRDPEFRGVRGYFNRTKPHLLDIRDRNQNNRNAAIANMAEEIKKDNDIVNSLNRLYDDMADDAIKQSTINKQNYEIVSIANKDFRDTQNFLRDLDPYRYDRFMVQSQIDALQNEYNNQANALQQQGLQMNPEVRRNYNRRMQELIKQQREIETRHKNELDKEALTIEKMRAEIRGADAKQDADIARAKYDRLKYKMDIDTALAQVGGRHAEILKDQDIKKMNDAVPSLLVVKFRRPDSIAYTEYLIGVKAKLLPVTTEEVIRRIINDNKDGKKFLKFMRTITGELRLSNALFALSRMKEDLKSTRVHGTYGDTWNLLKNRAEAARISVKFGQQNDFSAITTVLISKADADDLFRQENIDITKEKETLHFMSSYNLLAFIIVDDATETMKIMFDDGTKQFEEVSYTMLERDSASSYKKVVDLMSTFK